MPEEKVRKPRKKKANVGISEANPVATENTATPPVEAPHEAAAAPESVAPTQAVSQPTEEPKHAQKPQMSRDEVLARMQETRLERELAIKQEAAETVKLQQVKSAIKSGFVLYGTISQIENIGNSVYSVVMLKDGTRVIVPYSETYETNIIDMSTVNLHTERGKADYAFRQQRQLAKLFGMEIPIVLTRYDFDDEKGIVIFGSRKKANTYIRRQSFYGSKPDFVNNNTYEATFLSVHSTGAALTLGGKDFTVPLHKLTERYVSDLTNLVAVGDKKKVKITEVKTFEDDGKFNVEFVPDFKAPERDAYLERAPKIGVGAITQCIVTNIYPRKSSDGTINEKVVGWLPMQQVPCTISRLPMSSNWGVPIENGTALLVQVKQGKNADGTISHYNNYSGRVFVDAIRVLGNPEQRRLIDFCNSDTEF